MKVLSLLQPWASLVVIGAKQIETRSWNTKYRGPVLIHASKRKIPGLLTLQCSWHFDEAFKPFGGTMSLGKNIDFSRDLPFGAIIGMVDLIDTFPTEKTWASSGVIGFKSNLRVMDGDLLKYVQITHQEKAFGDYSPGRFGWILSNPVQFETRIPVKGSLGLWEYKGPIPFELTYNQERERSCRVCGCTDIDCRQCVEKTGRPCSWVAEDLCSACV